MSLFVDTSAILALIDADQPWHEQVAEAWTQAVDGERALYTSNYVLVETFALVQRRLGVDALRDVTGGFVPMLRPLWVDPAIHEAALSALLAAGRRGLSFVDCTSFEVMRRNGLSEALAVDRDFSSQGFRVTPSP